MKTLEKRMKRIYKELSSIGCTAKEMAETIREVWKALPTSEELAKRLYPFRR